MMPIVSPCPRRPTAPAPQRRRFWRHSRDGRGRRDSHPPADHGRRQCDRGRMGHNPLPWPTPDEVPGPPCWCGRSGCLETFLSGPALAADHHRRYRQTLSAPEIAEAAAAGDPECRATLERYMDRLARGLASVINVVDPDAIVLGGGLSSISALYEQVPRLWTRYIFSDRVATPLLPPVHGASERRARRGVVVAAGRGAVNTLCRDCGALESGRPPKPSVAPSAAHRGWSAMPNSALWRSRMSIATRFMPPSKSATDPNWRTARSSSAAAPAESCSPAVMWRGFMACARRCRCSRRWRPARMRSSSGRIWRSTALSDARYRPRCGGSLHWSNPCRSTRRFSTSTAPKLCTAPPRPAPRGARQASRNRARHHCVDRIERQQISRKDRLMCRKTACNRSCPIWRRAGAGMRTGMH